MNKRKKGTEKELAAIRYLEKEGCRILAHSYYTRQGEIDIVCEREGVLAFVEVKYRKNQTAGLPEEAISPRKMQRICRAASYFVYTHPAFARHQMRFDVLAMEGEKIRYYENAFPYVDGGRGAF